MSQWSICSHILTVQPTSISRFPCSFSPRTIQYFYHHYLQIKWPSPCVFQFRGANIMYHVDITCSKTPPVNFRLPDHPTKKANIAGFETDLFGLQNTFAKRGVEKIVGRHVTQLLRCRSFHYQYHLFTHCGCLIINFSYLPLLSQVAGAGGSDTPQSAGRYLRAQDLRECAARSKPS